MSTPFQLYSLARQKLTDLVSSLTTRELYYIGGPIPLRYYPAFSCFEEG